MEINYPHSNQPIPPADFRPWVGPFIVLMVLFTAAGSLFYQVGPDEKGVVQRFGQYVRTTDPGLQWKLPFGIETVKKVRVTHVFKEEFGFRTAVTGARTLYAGRDQSYSRRGAALQRFSSSNPYIEESLMLTGDLNVAVVEWIVQYTIKDPVQFAFRVRDPQETIRNMSEAVMRLVIGDHTINQVLTAGRETIQTEVETMLQDVLDSYSAGIDIRNVILQDVTPPDEVKPSFNEVNEARQEKEKLINQAWEEYNRVIPRAKGQAEQQVRDAEGYALERTNRAKGDAERFMLTWEAYRKAPDVTRQRLFLEMTTQLFPKLRDKWIVDDDEGSLLRLLSLNPERGGTKQ